MTLCKTVRTYYVPYHFVGPFYALFRFLAVVLKTKRKHLIRTITVGTLSLLTPSLWAHPHCGHTLTPSLWACTLSLWTHPHNLTVGIPSLLTPSLWAHSHILTVGTLTHRTITVVTPLLLTPSLWSHPHSSHPHCGHTAHFMPLQSYLLSLLVNTF